MGTRLQVPGQPPVALTDGVAVVTTTVPATPTLAAFDSNGRRAGELSVAEPDADRLMFNEPIFRRW